MLGLEIRLSEDRVDELSTLLGGPAGVADWVRSEAWLVEGDVPLAVVVLVTGHMVVEMAIVEVSKLVEFVAAVRGKALRH